MKNSYGYWSHFFILTKALAKINFKLQSQGKFLGAFWHILNPLLAFGVLLVIFSGPIGQNIENYPLYLLSGIIVFNLFLQTTNQAVRVIRDQRNVIKSVNFPQESLISSLVLSHLLIHALEMIIFSIVLLTLRSNIDALIFYPVIALGMVILTYGTSLLLASLTTYILDLENIWHHSVRLLWFVTPIFYLIPSESLMFKLNYYFNPLYQYITITRDLLIYHRSLDWHLTLLATLYTVIIFLTGTLVFNRIKHKLAEII